MHVPELKLKFLPDPTIHNVRGKQQSLTLGSVFEIHNVRGKQQSWRAFGEHLAKTAPTARLVFVLKRVV